MTLLISDIIQIIGILVSLFTSIVAIFISVKSVKQNSKMIEESTRAVISIYGQSINSGSPQFYIVVKNFGNSPAHIQKFEYDCDFVPYYLGQNPKRDFLQDLNNSVIAPGQSRICALSYSAIESPVNFTVIYTSGSKTYHETSTVDLKAGTSMLTVKSSDNKSELHNISYTLQEMLQKNL